MNPFPRYTCRSSAIATFVIIAVVLCCLAPAICLAGQSTVFIYHRFGESRYPSTNIAVDIFAAHIRTLKDSGQLILPLSEIVEHLRAGRHLPAKSVAITVDDAFDSFLQEAMPIIRQYRIPVTLFVNTDGVGASGYLDWPQLRKLVREGVDIGNHTATHDYLLERAEGESRADWEKRVRSDILKAQDAFSRELGFRPILFAYPYGEYSPELAEIVRGLGFQAAIAQQSGVISEKSDLFALPRFPMGGPFASLKSFQDKLSMAPFDLDVVAPLTPVLKSQDPPVLKVRIPAGQYDLTRLQGFVQGDNRLQFDVRQVAEGIVSVTAEKPLSGRRNKYTLTAPLKDGSGWAWFSQPWFRLKSDF